MSDLTPRRSNRRNSRAAITYICPVCEHEFRRYPSDVAKFCSRTCANSGENNHFWKGGRNFSVDGYIRVWVPGRGRIPEHRLVMEKRIGRLLGSDEVVHHIDGDPTNNSPDNLEMHTRESHPKEHQRYTDEKLIEAIHELARRIGRRPAQKELDNFPDLPSRSAFVNHFGSWGNALDLAGYPPYDHNSHSIHITLNSAP